MSPSHRIGSGLERDVGRLLLKAGESVAAAESCTGGLLGARITSVSGSSSYYNGGTIAYSDHVKTRRLGVPARLIAEHGAVSRQVAAAMARRVRTLFGADWGIGITGIAGPGGGTGRKPVGLVFVAVAGKGCCQVRRMVFAGGRDAVRKRACDSALRMLRDSLTNV